MEKISINIGFLNPDLFMRLLEGLTYNKGRNYNENKATEFKILAEDKKKCYYLS